MLVKVFENIDPRLHKVVALQDHAIIYFEAYQISKKAGLVPNAVFHEEPRTVRELYDHYFSWGLAVGEKLEEMPEKYRKMLENKTNNRSRSVEWNANLFLVAPILFIKGLGYYIGLLVAKRKLRTE